MKKKQRENNTQDSFKLLPIICKIVGFDLIHSISTVLLYGIVLFLGLVISCQAQDNDLSQNFNKVELASVYDGDTIRVHLACKYGVFCKTIPIRVRGVDCPEIKGGSAETKAFAKQAKAFTKNFLKGGKILLRNCGRDKYFRLLCDVKVNGQSLGEELIKAGHAIPYDGGTKMPISIYKM